MDAKMKPLSLETLEGGYFRVACQNAIERMQAEMLAHVDQYGVAAKGQKAKVLIAVEIAVADFDDDNVDAPAFAVAAKIKYVPAPRPARLSLARKRIDATGEQRMVVEQLTMFAGEDAPEGDTAADDPPTADEPPAIDDPPRLEDLDDGRLDAIVELAEKFRAGPQGRAEADYLALKQRIAEGSA